MKWYIFNGNNEPLYWDEDVLEFDTKASAIRFLDYASNYGPSFEFWGETTIIQTNWITPLGCGYKNASNLIPIWDYEEKEFNLIDAEGWIAY